MRFWLPLMFEPTSQFHDIARLAERHGFEGLALADHVLIPEHVASVHPSGENPFTPETAFQDPLVSIASMAAVTTRLKFMPYVYILPMRDPFSVAKQVGTLSDLADQRVSMGVGAGWLAEEMEVLGHDFHRRGRRLDEMLTIIRDLWDDGWCEFHGAHYDVPRSAMFPVPSGPIPIWVGGKSVAALRRAARHDGWLGMNYDVDEIPVLLDTLTAARREAGSHTRNDFEVMVIPNAVPDVDRYRELEERGVTSTIGMPWMLGDPAFSSIAAKGEAMARFAETFIAPLTR